LVGTSGDMTGIVGITNMSGIPQRSKTTSLLDQSPVNLKRATRSIRVWKESSAANFR
jgi:hypothetical protein